MTYTAYTVDWTTSHAETWTHWLAPWAGQPGIAGLEIGAHEGRSSRWFCERVLTGRGSYLVCVDKWSDQDAERRFRENVKGLPVYWRKALAVDAIARLTVEGRRYVFGYADADHSAAETLSVLCAVWPLILPGGLIIADDYRWTSANRPIPPGPGIDAFLSCFADRIARTEESAGQLAIWKPEIQT